MTVAAAGNHRLDVDFDALSGRDRGDLSAARTDLADAAVTERTFDRSLRALRLPAPMQSVAEELIAANEARADVTDQAATAESLAQLASYAPRLTAMNVSVEREVRRLRALLGLPPPETS